MVQSRLSRCGCPDETAIAVALGVDELANMRYCSVLEIHGVRLAQLATNISCMNEIGKNGMNRSHVVHDMISAVLQENQRDYTPRVGIFGNTGAGKSSLCNALFGRAIAKVSDVEACTREPQEILIGQEGEGAIILVDVPGVGEDLERHCEYIDVYKRLVPELDMIIWAIKSDDRSYASAIDAYRQAVAPSLPTCPVVFAITQADKVKPDFEWDYGNNIPSENQLTNLKEKKADISDKFKIPTSMIVAVSAEYSYNLVELIAKVIEILPIERKFPFPNGTAMYIFEIVERSIFDLLKRADSISDEARKLK